MNKWRRKWRKEEKNNGTGRKCKESKKNKEIKKRKYYSINKLGINKERKEKREENKTRSKRKKTEPQKEGRNNETCHEEKTEKK